ncbi:NB-ARC domain protein [Mycoavidus cysteinexigens]|uniref:NB-ARC domain protein n=2 Tax=Mycoavidus cysteinexigens TaxID=1553431 RepID=A0A2Z6EST4_9BURK|nr:NB-ARC domain protein [Mycoavidus cysteinexigens]GLR00983.1 hypothetical protein GCM10007934_07950 [Mycoavidus cysteinexigens]
MHEAYDAEMQSVTQTSIGLVSIPVSGSNHQVEVHYHGTGLDLTLLETLIRQQNFALQPNTVPLANLGESIETMRQNYLSVLQVDETIRDALSLYVGPEGKAVGSVESGERFDLRHKLNAFLESDKKVFLLLGEAGSGKSTFNRYLARQLWANYELADKKEDERIPVFIQLTTLKDPNENLLTEYFTEEGFSKEQIQQLRQSRRFIFILDGYDEIKHRQRVFYTDNKLDKWDAKVIISSRPEYLGPSYQSKFYPSGQARVFEECELAQFSKAAIRGYIESHVRHAKSKWNVEQYQSALSHPDLQALIGNPFLLKVVLEVLPSLGSKEGSSNRNSYTRGALYEQFAKNWFGRSQSRLQGIQLTREEQKTFNRLAEEDFVEHGIHFSQEFALALYKKQVLVATYSTGQASEGQEWGHFLSNDDEKTRLLRFNAPLSRKGNQYRFIHKSLRDYFVARALWEELGSGAKSHEVELSKKLGVIRNVRPVWESLGEGFEFESSVQFNALNVVEDPAVQSFLVERVQEDRVLLKALLAWVKVSKSREDVKRGASNALTVLVKAGVQFNGCDLRGIQVPGSDLSNGVFDSAQLQGSDLSGANLRAIWLREANLNGSQMSGVQFGEWPYLKEEGVVNSCAYSPDGKICAMGLGNGTIRVYATSNWEKIHTLRGHTFSVRGVVYSPSLRGHTNSVLSVAYSPSGLQLASGSYDCTVRLWDAESGALSHTLAGHTSNVTSVAYSPSGLQLASGSYDCTVRLWDAESGALSHTLEGHTNRVNSVAYSPSGMQVASGSHDQTVRLWDVESGALAHTLAGHTSNVISVAYSPSGLQLASGSYDKTVRLWDAESGALSHTLEGHTNWVNSVAYSPSGTQVASGSHDRTVRLWDAESGALAHTLAGHTSHVYSVAYSPSGSQIASGSWGGTMHLWEAQIGALGHTLRGHTEAVSSVTYSPSGMQLASGSYDKTVRLWEAQSGALVHTLRGHTSYVNSVVYSPSGTQVASGSDDNTVHLWDAQSGALGHTLRGHTEAVSSVTYSPSGMQLASGSGDKMVRLWEAQSGTLVHTLRGHTSYVNSVVYSPSGTQVASGSYDCTVRLWEAQSGILVHTLRGHTLGVISVVYSPSGMQFASGSADNTVRLWEVQSGTLVHTLKGHTDFVSSVVYSPRGSELASGSSDKTIRVWEVYSGACLKVIQEFTGEVNSVAWKWRHNEAYLLSGSADNSLRAWELKKDGGEYKAMLCWSTWHGVLMVRDTLLEGVVGLSEMNKKLLKQRGAALA